MNPNNPRTCDICAENFDKVKRSTPCDTCSKVRLLDENEVAAELFGVLMGQLRVGGMGGVLGVDYATLPFLMQIYGVPVEDAKFYFDKIQLMVSRAVSILNKNSREREAAKT